MQTFLGLTYKLLSLTLIKRGDIYEKIKFDWTTIR